MNGGDGIRTRETLLLLLNRRQRLPDPQSGAINHSATPPDSENRLATATWDRVARRFAFSRQLRLSPYPADVSGSTCQPAAFQHVRGCRTPPKSGVANVTDENVACCSGLVGQHDIGGLTTDRPLSPTQLGVDRDRGHQCKACSHREPEQEPCQVDHLLAGRIADSRQS